MTAEAHAESCPKKILIVDDNPSIRALLSCILQRKGFLVYVASEGKEAVDFLKNHADSIDLALVDVNMPDMDGPQTLATCRAINPRLACCFITGGSQDYDDRDLMEFGVRCIFKKPITSLPDFLEKIQGMTNKIAE
ncbi:MAG: response regulator [Planctomycetes bacterium]|nr:response regulator [Planctomycetota bacterium]